MTVVLAAALLPALEAIVGALRGGRLLDEAPVAAADAATVRVVIADVSRGGGPRLDSAPPR